MSSDVERLLSKARRSISKYCVEECQAYCCRKGRLLLTIKEAELITSKKIGMAETQGMIIKSKLGGYNLLFENNNDNCPKLQNNKCLIHNRKDRPQTCKDFPIYLKNDVIMFSSKCAAVQANQFFPYMRKIISKGYLQTNVNNIFKKKNS
ncbi:MAG: YkgJ family cysteine cluster protein [Nanoarchaeota archaeon]|nr:YkgJ family cysteine cluster protein [Nanoarchaeota archaeon]MBU1855342.1 YkgJ family cysteine cluster protein [Nanoarchaeota archaeon]